MDVNSQKTALITGGSSGIGKEFAIQLSNKGYNLILIARNEEKLLNVKTSIENQNNAKVEYIIADLSETSGIELVKKKIKEINNLHYLINSAGYPVKGKFEETRIEKFTKLIHVQIIATIELSHAVIPLMKKQALGTIINVSSIAAFVRNDIYASAKRFLVNFSKYLERQLEGTNIVVQALCPGYTYTNFHKSEEYTSRGINPYKSYPKFLWMDPDDVVSASLNGVEKKKNIVIPRLFYKFAVFLARLGLLKF